MNSAKKNADKGVFSHNEHDSLTFFSANILQAKNGKLLIVVCFTRLRCTHTPCLSAWLHLRFSYRKKILSIVVSSYFSNWNTSFVMKFKPFPELTDILLCEQYETSGGYWHKLKHERGRLFS